MKKQSVMKWLFQRLGRRLPGLLLLTAASVGTSLFAVWFALGSKDVVNAAVGGTQQELLWAAVNQAAIILGLLLCLTLQRYLHSRLGAELDRDWKRELTHKILRSDYARISEFHSGELINLLNNDVKAIDDGLLSVVPNLASMVTKLVAVIAVLIAMAPIFTLAALVLGAVVILFTGYIRRYLRELNKAVSASNGKVSGFLQEIFEKLLLVQAMNVEQEVELRGDRVMDERYGLQKKRWMASLAANTSISVLGYTSGFVALVWCAQGLYKGTMSYGELMAVTQLVGQLQAPFVSLSGIMPKYMAMMASCERLMELEDACRRQDVPMNDAGTTYEDMLAICAEELTFSYGRDQIFESSSFSLPKGAFAVITGPSGVGKSTLLKLLLGIFEPTSGKLYFSGKNGTVSAGRGARNLFAYVPQGNLLFSGTLRENLLLTCPDATQEQIEQAIYVSHMDGFLSQLPQGRETVLGENAHGLSEGQAQRLSIARAILGGAPILLLDEATSALDAQSEAIVLQRIRQLPGKTCIAVTHRPGAVELADWQLAVENGCIHCRKIK